MRSFVLRSERAEDGHHRAPIGECRLNKVQCNKSGEQKPVTDVQVPKEQARQNDATGNLVSVAFLTVILDLLERHSALTWAYYITI